MYLSGVNPAVFFVAVGCECGVTRSETSRRSLATARDDFVLTRSEKRGKSGLSD